ncbi:MAG TPA: serine hydrolase domain-containing protein [Candidatus Limnocylindria bacterium]|nr:serine hydrolase domain-containing protein [Candidatus Limnocylindria bacterium]
MHREVAPAVAAIAHRHPAVGLAVGVVSDGGLACFAGHGLADIASGTPVTKDTVFRIGSITKTLTGVAVMQLWEQGLLDLDAPVNRYLRAFPLVADREDWRHVTVRHLLTHTAGVPDVRSVRDLLRGGMTPADGRPPVLSVPFGEALPSLADHYADGLRVVAEPGTAWAYSNPSFAALGQVVEDVTGQPLDRYLRQHVFAPLGMEHSDLVRSDRVASRLATGYAMGPHGASPVQDRDWIGVGAGGAYATSGDLALYLAALLGGGANEHGRVLRASTLATMLEPQFQPDPRVPGMGLSFFRGDLGGHRVVYHDGILPGFNTSLVAAPDDGIGVFGMTNGSAGAFAWLQVELDALTRHLLGIGDEDRHAPHHPELWPAFCGRYVLPPGVADVRERLMLGGGIEVLVRGGRLLARVLTPIPILFRGFPLEPADRDPDVFRVDLSSLGMAPVRVVFGTRAGGRAMALHTDVGGQPWSLRRAPAAPGWRGPAVRAGLAAAAATAVLWRRRRV